MTEIEAKRIGSVQALFAVRIGLLIAQLIMTLLYSGGGFIKGFFWFMTFPYKLNIVIGVIIMLLSGHFFGQIAGKAILIKKQNYILVGVLCGIAILLTTAFLSSWTGYFQEGINSNSSTYSSFQSYIISPFITISFFGILPVFIAGIWFGHQVKRFKNP